LLIHLRKKDKKPYKKLAKEKTKKKIDFFVVIYLHSDFS